jgi:peptide chain release factor 2/peptide chain release factor
MTSRGARPGAPGPRGGAAAGGESAGAAAAVGAAAFLVEVTAGRGPAEVGAFVAQLADRLAALCARARLEIVRREATGPAGAPRSVALLVRGSPAALAGEAGTHALVAPSARRGKAARKRWFAGVSIEALAAGDDPLAPLARAIRLDAREVRVRAARAGGPGGQNVNKVATAVRAEHVPSGLRVRAAGERSQHANRRAALARLEAALARAEDARHAEAKRARRGRHDALERGRPVREYRLDADGRLVAPGDAPPP